jgi:hypothetical protein
MPVNEQNVCMGHWVVRNLQHFFHVYYLRFLMCVGMMVIHKKILKSFS